MRKVVVIEIDKQTFDREIELCGKKERKKNKRKKYYLSRVLNKPSILTAKSKPNNKRKVFPGDLCRKTLHFHYPGHLCGAPSFSLPPCHLCGISPSFPLPQVTYVEYTPIFITPRSPMWSTPSIIFTPRSPMLNIPLSSLPPGHLCGISPPFSIPVHFYYTRLPTANTSPFSFTPRSTMNLLGSTSQYTIYGSNIFENYYNWIKMVKIP